MKKKNKKFGKKIAFVEDIDPYSQTCIIILNGTFNEAIKIFHKNQKNKNSLETLEHIKKHTEEYPPDFQPKRGCGTLFTELPHGYVLMFNHDEMSWISTVCLVAHEVLHLVHYVLRRAGIELTKESEEAYTYLQADIMEKILKKIY